jgi:hypothetical protein
MRWGVVGSNFWKIALQTSSVVALHLKNLHRSNQPANCQIILTLFKSHPPRHLGKVTGLNVPKTASRLCSEAVFRQFRLSMHDVK